MMKDRVAQQPHCNSPLTQVVAIHHREKRQLIALHFRHNINLGVESFFLAAFLLKITQSLFEGKRVKQLISGIEITVGCG